MPILPACFLYGLHSKFRQGDYGNSPKSRFPLTFFSTWEQMVLWRQTMRSMMGNVGRHVFALERQSHLFLKSWQDRFLLSYTEIIFVNRNAIFTIVIVRFLSYILCLGWKQNDFHYDSHRGPEKIVSISKMIQSKHLQNTVIKLF